MWLAKIWSSVDPLEELVEIVRYTYAKSSLETGGFTRGHIPALLLGQVLLPTHPQQLAGHVRTHVQLPAKVPFSRHAAAYM